MTLQRKKSILLKRLKSPPAVNQFNYTIDKNQATQLLRLLKKFRGFFASTLKPGH